MRHQIAMWSGPRNISTALMRAWGARPDTIVADEPFYAHYLQHSGYTHHPGYEEILANHETDWRQVIRGLNHSLPEGKTVLYQKQMAHHLLPHISLDWTDVIDNVFLIRNPSEMLPSLLEFFPNPTIEETGLPQQTMIFQRLQNQGRETPAVLDAKDVLLNPRAMLMQLCERVGLNFCKSMLQWEPGIHPSDGVWARHWYKNVANSTAFAPYRQKRGAVPAKHHRLLNECHEHYEALAEHRIQLPANRA